MRKAINSTEAETKMYWRLAGELKVAFEGCLPIQDIIDEMEVLRDYTDSPVLVERINTLCKAYVKRYEDRLHGNLRAMA